MKDETPETSEPLMLSPNLDCEGEHTERLSGSREPLPAFAEDADAPVSLEAFAFSIRRAPSGRALKVGDVFHPLRDRKERKGVFVREGYAVPTVGGPDVLVLHLRKWLLLLPLALCAVLLALALRTCGTTSQAPAPHYMDGQTQTEGAEPSQPVASIEYASYEATMDGEWRANAIDQIFSLSLPASSTHGGTTGKNPVDSSPSIYVDINADGDFEPDECVYNAPDSSGYGHLLRAGSRVDSIELVRPLDAGTYSALTVWRSVLAGTSTPAGHTSFAWTLTVS
jgi:hypothetical protein